jgi:hypothetical protein
MRSDPGRERVSVFAPTKFRAIAAADKRSVSNLAFKILSDYVERHGAAPPLGKIKSMSIEQGGG